MSDADADGTWVDESDWELSDSDVIRGCCKTASGPPPVVAVVGRPNVGKSTLVNRILGRREAVVQDVPGVTRDRVSYDATWVGRRFLVQDTGGWEPDAKGLQQLVAEQASVAMRTADAIILVVDAVVGATAGDEAAARMLRRSGKPVFSGGQQGGHRARRGRRRGVVVAGAGGAAPDQCHARSGSGRPARPGRRVAACGVGGRRRRGRATAGGAGGQAERRQEFPAEQACRRRAGSGARRGGHHRRPGGLTDRIGRQDLAFRRHGGAATQGRPGQRA